MNKEKKDIIFNSAVSAMIGLVVGFVEIISPTFDTQTLYILIKNAATGLLIGVAIRNFSVYFWDKLSRKQMYLYSSLILTCIIALPKILEYLLWDKAILTLTNLILLILAFIFGMAWTNFSFRYFGNMNYLLDVKKEALKVQNTENKK